ncbi:MAG: AsnC family transcriptional regulator [Nitrososphaerota archaeon]|nr:AsnC family transcriptional regulator [Nitrososphaerota archaeon]
MMDVQPQSGKSDMIKKLKLVHEITGLVDFYGTGLRLFVIYNGDVSRSRTIELISRITNAEKITRSRMVMPRSETKHLTGTDVAIIRALSKDARKPPQIVARELGLSTKTVRNRVERLRNENTIFPFPILNIECVPGLIPIYLSYVYTNNEAKASVDRAVISHFDANYITGSFPDPDMGHVVLGASSMADVNEFSAWAKSQPGIASVRVDIPTMTFMFPEKLIELAALRDEKEAFLKDALL